MRISYSALNTYKSCPEKYHNQKMFRPPLNSSALPFGSAVESGVDALLKGAPLAQALGVFKDEWTTRPSNKWQAEQPVFDSTDIFYYASDFDKHLLTKTDVKLMYSWIREIYEVKEGPGWDDIVKDVQERIKEDKPVDPKDRKFYHRVLWLCSRRRGMLLVKAFRDDLLPQISELIHIQKGFTIENEEEDKVNGYIDYIVKLKGKKEPVILDLKTSGKLYDTHSIVSSDQLRIYAAAMKINTIGYMVLFKKISWDIAATCVSCGHQRENARLKNCAKCYDKKKNPEGKYLNEVKTPKVTTQLLTRELTNDEVTDVLNDCSEIITAIQNNIKWKNPDSCFNFNAKCEFYDVCWNNKTMEELKQEHKK